MPLTGGGAPFILFSLQAKTGNGAQALARKVSAEAPPLGIVGDSVSFSGCLSTKGNAIIQGGRKVGAVSKDGGLNNFFLNGPVGGVYNVAYVQGSGVSRRVLPGEFISPTNQPNPVKTFWLSLGAAALLSWPAAGQLATTTAARPPAPAATRPATFTADE